MTQTSRKQHFVGKGVVSLGLAGSVALLEGGNTSKADLNVTEETKDFPDYQSAAGGSASYSTRISSVGVSLELRILSPENLAIAYHGTNTAVAAATAQVKTLIGAIGVIPLLDIVAGNASLKDTTPAAWVVTTAYTVGQRVKSGTGLTTHIQVVTIAGTSGASAPTWSTSGSTVVDGTVTWQDEGLVKTYTAGTDYVVNPGSLTIPPTSTIMVGRSLDFTYDRSAHYVLDALTSAAHTWILHIEGLNDADDGSPVILDIPLVKFGAAKNLPVIGSDFAALMLEGRVIKSVPGAPGQSAYFQVRQPAATP